MKKVILSLVVATSVIVACTPKASKTPLPEETPTATAGSAEAGGLIIASAKCTKCHDNKTEHVPKHTFAEQENLMMSMSKKAKLSEQETADLLAYVKTNAKS